MPSETEYRSQAEALLRLAAATENLRDRSDLIDEAARWSALARACQEGAGGAPRRPAEPASFLDDDAPPRTPRRPGTKARRGRLRRIFRLS